MVKWTAKKANAEALAAFFKEHIRHFDALNLYGRELNMVAEMAGLEVLFAVGSGTYTKLREMADEVDDMLPDTVMSKAGPAGRHEVDRMGVDDVDRRLRTIDKCSTILYLEYKSATLRTVLSKKKPSASLGKHWTRFMAGKDIAGGVNRVWMGKFIAMEDDIAAGSPPCAKGMRCP